MDGIMWRRDSLRTLWSLVAAVALLVLIAPAEVSAQGQSEQPIGYDFDPDCSPVESTDVVSVESHAMLMLDRSGSMRYLGSELCSVEVCCYSDGGYGGCGDWSSSDNESDIPEPHEEGCTEPGTGNAPADGFGRCTGCVFGDPGGQSFQECCYQEVTSDADETLPLCGDNLWDVAVDSITNVVQIMNNDIHFGIGFFPSTTIAVEAGPGSWSDVITALNGTGPSGGTPTHEAINEVRDSDTLSEDRAAGILISDGIPNERQTTVDRACNVRDNFGQQHYAVGLGGATDQEYNSLLAAAMGTGCCGPDADEDCSQGIGVDPCDYGSWHDVPGPCYGSPAANNQDEFTEVLSQISADIACTYPVDTSHFSDPNDIPDDPDAFRIRLQPQGASDAEYNLHEIHHASQNDSIANPYCDGGWEFASGSNDEVVLLGECCGMLQAEEISTVHTQLTCNCYDTYEGDWCLIPNSSSSPPGCPAGIRRCQSDHTYKCEMEQTFPPGGSGCTPPSQNTCVRGECVNNDDLCIQPGDCGSGQECINGVCRNEGELVACDNGTAIPLPDSDCPGIDLPLVPETPGVCVRNRCLEEEEVPCENTSDCSGDDRCYDGICRGECEACPFNCPAGLGGEPCSDECEVTYYPGSALDPDDEGELIVDCPDGVDPGSASTRCGIGSVLCDGTSMAVCDEESALRPMPELCDGLDNSCDGKVDNIEESWAHWRAGTGPFSELDEYGYELSDIDDDYYEGAACFERDVCSCPEGTEHVHVGAGSGASIKDEFDAHIGAWTTDAGCRCAASMSE